MGVGFVHPTVRKPGDNSFERLRQQVVDGRGWSDAILGEGGAGRAVDPVASQSRRCGGVDAEREAERVQPRAKLGMSPFGLILHRAQGSLSVRTGIFEVSSPRGFDVGEQIRHARAKPFELRDGLFRVQGGRCRKWIFSHHTTYPPAALRAA